MQNLTQIHLKAKHGLMLGGEISHFLAFTISALRWRERNKEEKKKKKTI